MDLLVVVGALSGLAFCEDSQWKSAYSTWYKSSSVAQSLPRLYGAVIIVNLVIAGLAIIALGFKVSAARKMLTAKAKGNGDNEAELRFNVPKMQAEGFSAEATLFNCIQRGHQQALETLPHFFVLSMISGIYFPATTTFTGVIYIFSRWQWAKGYATGVAKDRYSLFMSKNVWSTLLFLLLSSSYIAVKMLMENGL